MLYCYDRQKSFPSLRNLRKHERVHRRLKSCQQCDAMFSSAEAGNRTRVGRKRIEDPETGLGRWIRYANTTGEELDR